MAKKYSKLILPMMVFIMVLTSAGCIDGSNDDRSSSYKSSNGVSNRDISSDTSSTDSSSEETLPDLNIVTIKVLPKPPVQNGRAVFTRGIDYTFYILVENIGDRTANNVFAKFEIQGVESGWVPSSHDLIEQGQSKELTAKWNPGSAGIHKIHIEVDPEYSIKESNKNNNIWDTTVVVK